MTEFESLYQLLEAIFVQPEFDFREQGIPALDNPKKRVAKVGHHWVDANKVLSFPERQVDNMNFKQTEPPESWDRAWVPDETEREYKKAERHEAGEIHWPSLPLIYKNRLAKAASEAYAEALGGEGHQWSYEKWMGRVWSQGWRFFGTMYGGIMARNPKHDKIKGWQLKGDYGTGLAGKMGIKLGLDFFMKKHGEEPIYTCATPEIFDLISKAFPDQFVKFTGKAAGMILPTLLKHQNVKVDEDGTVHWADAAGDDHPKFFFANKAFYRALQHEPEFIDQIKDLKAIPPRFLNQFIDILKQLDVLEPEVRDLLCTDIDYEWDPEQTKAMAGDIYGKYADRHGHSDETRAKNKEIIDDIISKYADFDKKHPNHAAKHFEVPQTPDDFERMATDMYDRHVTPYADLVPSRWRSLMQKKARRMGEHIAEERPEFEKKLEDQIKSRFTKSVGGKEADSDSDEG